MSSSEPAISVTSLGKEYLISHKGSHHTTAAEAIAHRFRNPIRREQPERFWALRDVTFEIEKGDVVGIIGRNGAGKSTLLKVLSRITEPTTGQAVLNGRVGSLLEVGTGFHSELTGRENIYLNGAILGMTRREITRHFNDIVEFAGCEQFLDTQVKRYSSGMCVRLAFAVAAHLDTEIIIVDEVLAVGDAEFQKKCLGKIHDVAKGGRTVLFVSHNMQPVADLCKWAILLDRGRVSFTGDVLETIEKYLSTTLVSRTLDDEAAAFRPGAGQYRYATVQPSKSTFLPDEKKSIEFRIRHKHSATGRLHVAAHIVNMYNQHVVHLDSRLIDAWFSESALIEGTISFASPWLRPGNYRVDMSLSTEYEILDSVIDACTFDVAPIMPYSGSAPEASNSQGIVLGEYELEVDNPLGRSKRYLRSAN